MKLPVSTFIFLLFFTGALFAEISPQVEWLKNQQDLHTSGLVDSYEGDGTNRAYLYDQGLAIIAFTEANEISRAKMVLDKIAQLQDAGGGWYECFNANDPVAVTPGFQQYNTGPISWMVIAINFYEVKTGDPNYSVMARNALSQLETLILEDANDEACGAVKYCAGPDCVIPNAISSEHNHDAFSAFYWRGILDSNDLFLQRAGGILDYLRGEMWAPSLSSNSIHDVNIFWRGFADFEYCTDNQSWGILSLGPLGPDSEEFHKSTEWLLFSQWGNTRNIQDFNDSVQNVDGFKSCTNQLEPYIWLEGTEGVAAAFYKICENSLGDYYHSQTSRVVSANGGIPHTFSEIDPAIIRWPDNYRLNSGIGFPVIFLLQRR
jgi:hypothetical protein